MTFLRSKYDLLKNGGCRINDYTTTFSSDLITLYLTPISYDSSLYSWLDYVKVDTTPVLLLYLSEFRLIQPARWDLSFTLPHNKVSRIILVFSESTFFCYCRKILCTFARIPTHHKSKSRLPYELLKPTHFSANPIQS